MNQVKAMASMQANKAFVAALLAALTAAIAAAEEGFTLVEVLTIIVALIVTFQATFWTTNAIKFDGDIDVIPQEDGKKIFSLNLGTDPDELDTKDTITFKINK